MRLRPDRGPLDGLIARLQDCDDEGVLQSHVSDQVCRATSVSWEGWCQPLTHT